jgi:hypothetical protein
MPFTTYGLLTDICSFLTTLGIGSYGTTIFRGTMPGSPTECVVVYATGGIRLPQDYGVVRPQFQIAVRAEDLAAGLAKAQTIYNALDDKWGGLSATKGRVTGDHLPGVNFRDSNGRFVFTLNFTALVQKL